MKIHIMVTADDGVCYEGDVVLARLSKGKKKTAAKATGRAAEPVNLKFSLNQRAFMNKR